MAIGYFEDEDGGALYPESIISETVNATTVVSEHPVEGEENVQDHAQPQAPTLTVEMIVSETPLPRPPVGFGLVGSGIYANEFVEADQITRGLNLITSSQAFFPDDEGAEPTVDENGQLLVFEPIFLEAKLVPNRELPYFALQWLMDRRGKRLTYYSSRFPEFRNCVITSISTVRTNRLALRITVELKRVRIAQAREVDIPPRKKRKIVDQPKVTTGAQPPKSAETPTDPPLASGLAGVRNFFGFSSN